MEIEGSEVHLGESAQQFGFLSGSEKLGLIRKTGRPLRRW
jgi:hypothetical protein